MTDIVIVEGLTFHYPTLTALNDVSFKIPKGSITALVGPNGAGKSTLMRCLTGLETPFAGNINVSDINILENQRLGHTKIGYLSDSFGLYDDLTVNDVLIFIGGCHHLSGPVLKERIAEIADLLRLTSVMAQKCGNLSRGWRQRVGIAMAIIHKPELLILDEPASGLDPEARSELSYLLKSLQQEGMTILVSSHILAELEEYCTAMLVIRDGTILNHTSLNAHVTEQKGTMLLSFVETPSTDQKEKISNLYESSYGPLLWHNHTLQMNVPHISDLHHEIIKQLMNEGLKVCGATVEQKKLQTLYLEIASSESH